MRFRGRVHRFLAQRMAAGRTMIGVAYALQRAEHGEQTYWMAITLAAMLGQIGYLAVALAAVMAA